MAWTAPRTFATGDSVDGDMMNEQIKENLDVLGAHTHTGATADGDDDLAGVDEITIGSTSEPSSPASGKIAVWVDGTTLKAKNSSGAIRIYTLGGHTH